MGVGLGVAPARKIAHETLATIVELRRPNGWRGVVGGCLGLIILGANVGLVAWKVPTTYLPGYVFALVQAMAFPLFVFGAVALDDPLPNRTGVAAGAYASMWSVSIGFVSACLFVLAFFSWPIDCIGDFFMAMGSALLVTLLSIPVLVILGGLAFQYLFLVLPLARPVRLLLVAEAIAAAFVALDVLTSRLLV